MCARISGLEIAIRTRPPVAAVLAGTVSMAVSVD
jgi:hypothetical protein